jgi:ribonuclease HI
MLFFDGSARQQSAGMVVVLVGPGGDQLKYVVRLEFKATNNMAEYEALIFGLSVALFLGVEREMCPWAISKYFGDLVSNTSA